MVVRTDLGEAEIKQIIAEYFKAKACEVVVDSTESPIKMHIVQHINILKE